MHTVRVKTITRDSYLYYCTRDVFFISLSLSLSLSLPALTLPPEVTPALAGQVADAAFIRCVTGFNRRRLTSVDADASPVRAHAAKSHTLRLPVIPCGLDWGAWPEPRPQPVERAAADSGEFRLVAVAQLAPYKALDVLLDALAIAQGRGLKFRAWIAGAGPERARLGRQRDRLGLAGVVKLAGAQSQAEVARALSDADAFVAPARREASGKMDGLPVALLEAMGAGVPVIATQLSGVPEVVQDGVTGMLVPSDDPARLAAALMDLSVDPALRQRLGSSGAGWVRKNYRRESAAAALAAWMGWAAQESALDGDPSGADGLPLEPEVLPVPRPPGHWDDVGIGRGPRDRVRGGAGSSTRYRMRLLEYRDREAVLDLYRLVWGPAEARRREVRWDWFRSRPGAKDDPGPSFVCEHAGRVIGVMRVVEMAVGGYEIQGTRGHETVHWIGSTLVHPDHRGAGPRLAARVRDALHLASGYPTPRMLGLWRRTDHQHELIELAQLKSWVRPLVPWGGLVPLRLIGELGLAGLDRWVTAGPLARVAGVEVRPIRDFSGGWAEWLARTNRTWPMTQHRDVATLQWLLLRDPVAPCDLYGVEIHGAPRALFALDFYADDAGRRLAALADLLAAQGDGPAQRTAIWASLALARARGAVALKALEPTHPEWRSVMRRAGFMAGRSAPRTLLLARWPARMTRARASDSRAWHITRVWADPSRF